MTALLSVEDLQIVFRTEDGELPAVDGVSFTVREGTTLGIVGESGCGKSVTALAIMGLIPDPPGKVTNGTITFGDIELTGKSVPWSDIRGKDIAMIFQEPMKALNPVLTVGYQIMESVIKHQKVTRKEAWGKALEMLELVGISGGDETMRKFSFELSGGMCQRIMIAIALSCNPKVLIADEPTTGLDVTIQAQVLRLINRLQKALGTAVVMITHDLGVIAKYTEDLVVMYCGKVVEKGSTKDVLNSPLHPYTKGLLEATPRLDAEVGKLAVIEGSVPPLTDLPSGCRFNDRCYLAKPHCKESEPPVEKKGTGEHYVACWEV